MSNPSGAIVILNWNGAGLLRRFLPSVIEFSQRENTEIIVADNGSTDNSIDLLQHEFPQVRRLILDQNYGFAKGYNEALKQIEADYFVILNSDVEVSPNWLEAPIELMESFRNIAAVQPKILSFNSKKHFEYAGAAGGFLDRLGYPFCRGRILNKVESDKGQYDLATDIHWASGACMFVRAEAFSQAGGFDPDFWAHMEEIDLCWRFRNQGLRIVYTPKSKVFHLGGGTLAYNNPKKLFLNFRNNLFLLFKNLPSEKLVGILFLRMILDGLAAFKLLAEFNLNGIVSVLKAHVCFWWALPRLIKKRMNIQEKKFRKVSFSKHAKSIIVQYYFRRRKRFEEIRF